MSRPTNGPIRTVILGAAGRDFHDFNVRFRDDPRREVVAFTAAQIPDIDDRRYPPALAGDRYPDGIPVREEASLATLIREEAIDECVLSYSDLPYATVMHLASIVQAAGADFRLLAPVSTMLSSTKPVVAICAVRTGCGKSQTTRRVSALLHERGCRTAVVRHPMPYGDLERQAVQRFADYDDLERHECTIEEREEYEPHLELGHVVFAGVDYARILAEAEREADVVVWDGGNNDLPFYAPDLHVVVADPHRAGHEAAYYPGETNVRMADLVLINKTDSATAEAVAEVEANVRRLNPAAEIARAGSPVTVDEPERIRGARVLVVDDGPTLTHGEMPFGAAALAARRHGARELVDPRPFAVGSIAETFRRYPHLSEVLPAMGYGATQRSELERTINASGADLVLIGTPIDLGKLLDLEVPTLRVRYELDRAADASLSAALDRLGETVTG